MVSDPFIAPGMNSLLWSKPQNQSREQLLTSTNNIATINLVGVSYLAGHCYSMKGPALGESVDVSLSSACIPPTSSRKPGQEQVFPA